MYGSFVGVTLVLSDHDPTQIEAPHEKDFNRLVQADGRSVISLGCVLGGMLCDAHDSIISITAFDSAADGSPRRSTASK